MQLRHHIDKKNYNFVYENCLRNFLKYEKTVNKNKQA